MKGKVHWRPLGLNAKKWHQASQVKGLASWLPAPKPPKEKARRGKTANQQPYEQAAP